MGRGDSNDIGDRHREKVDCRKGQRDVQIAKASMQGRRGNSTYKNRLET